MSVSMVSRAILLVWISLDATLELNLSPTASWVRNGVTIAGWANTTNGSALSQLSKPLGVVVGDNDVMYVMDIDNHRVVVVPVASPNNKSFIGSGPGLGVNELYTPSNVFIRNDSLYVLDYGSGRVLTTSLDGPNLTTVLNFNFSMYSLYFFVDHAGRIYLSSYACHQVVLFSDNTTSGTIVAGNGTPGPGLNQLQNPYGIFVTDVGVIYVVDCLNHRIVTWAPGALSGTVVAGAGLSGWTLSTLSSPTNVIVDNNDHMYISDSGNSRILRWTSGSTTGECIVACTGVIGTAANQLGSPHSLAFDRNGSLYVSEWNNNRVQRFLIQPDNDPFFNQPKFCSTPTWNVNAITFVNSSLVGSTPNNIFIDTSNTVYTAVYSLNRVHIWGEGTVAPQRNLTVGLAYPNSIFVTSNGDVYVDNAQSNNRVDRWTLNATNAVVAMVVNESCYGLFVDRHENIYCSKADANQVVQKAYGDATTVITVRAGGITAGSTAYLLNGSRGIFVDDELSLYVADCYNNRIQFFLSNQLNATTVAGTGAPVSSSLTCPSAVILDADKNFFIADKDRSRIFRLKSSTFSCIMGCSSAGPASNQLNQPLALSFDNVGNLFVVDTHNNRIQKFSLTVGLCSVTTAAQQTATSTVHHGTGNHISSNPTSLQTSTLALTTQQTTTNPLSTVVDSTTTYLSSFTSQSLTSVTRPTNQSDLLCDTLQPCVNDGTCNSTNGTSRGYICSCVPHFSGVHCEYDHRLCFPNICWNNGLCNETSNSTYTCLCTSGWYGTHCQTKIDYCQNITCENNGVCRALLLNYTCECLGDAYSGRQCENLHARTRLYRILAKSFAYIAIMAITIVALFVIIMDVLKYCLGIDLVEEELQRMRQAKKRQPPLVVRFIYVN